MHKPKNITVDNTYYRSLLFKGLDFTRFDYSKYLFKAESFIKTALYSFPNTAFSTKIIHILR